MITVNYILQNGGATVNFKGEAVTLKSGYQLSIKDCNIYNTKNFKQKHIDKLLKQATKRGEYAGFWVDSGKVYCDISKRIPTKAAAIELGKQYNQISVFDWKKQSCVFCG